MSEERQYVSNFVFPSGETFYVKDEDTYTKEEIDNKLVSVMTYKGTKAAVSELPNSGNQQGDVWHITADGSEWAWNGSSWEELGSSNAGSANAVLYTAQSLTNEQKEQARENIKAGTSSVRVNASDGTITIDDIYIGSANPHTYQFKTIFLITAVYSNGEYTFDRNQADILSAIQRGQLPVVRYHTTAGQNDYHVYYEWVFSYYTYDGEDVYIYFNRLDQYGNTSQLRWFASTGKAVVVTKPTLPSTTSADSGKVPVVNSFGNYQLQTPSGTTANAVLYTPQTLTDSQKTQARTNIGAGTYSKPSGGIPASDLAAGVIPDISGKANAADVYTKTEIDNKGYQTSAQVQSAIDAALAAIPSAESEAF